MADVICMPKLGFNMDEGQLVRWNKAVGEEVKKGEVLFEINTDKTTMPVEATRDGVLLKIMLEEDEYAAVFTPIAVVGEPDEDPDEALQAFRNSADAEPVGSPQPDKDPMEKTQQLSETAPETDIKDLKVTPRAKKLIAEEGIDIESIRKIKGTGYQGGITSRDIKASPLAKKLASKSNVDLDKIEGSGINGKIMKEDVAKAQQMNVMAASDSAGDKVILSVKPYKGIRKAIGEKMAASKAAAPHCYFTQAVDTTNITWFRQQINEGSDQQISISDILIYAVSKALEKYPEFNSSIVADNIVTYKSINIGVAVAGREGLVVPVIKNVQDKTLEEVSKENRALVNRAKENRLNPDEYSGGTFSISNLGMFGIDNFSAVINPPESAILAVSSVRKMPVVIEEKGEERIEIRPMMNIQLSADHRVADGLQMAQFIGCLKELLENPVKILL